MMTISEREFMQLVDYVKDNYGINLVEKKVLIVARLQNILVQKGFNSFSEYYNYVITDKTGEAVISLVDKITTNYTFFLREADHFDYFKKAVLPYLISRYSKNKDLRIWSAGCSTGEEPYTLAMCIDEYFDSKKDEWETKVLATDISKKVLDVAKEGIYSNEQIKSIPPSWRLNYFKKIDGQNSMVVEKIKNEVIFRTFNLMNDKFPFMKKMHVIFCRNVMIYFDPHTKMNLVNKFYELIEPGGYLFIGHSETLNPYETGFKLIKTGIYRKE